MATPYFKFKQFTVWHDKCAMKVGTDGVLLGALAPIEGKQRVLDVGTGTGLIAMMLAQRSASELGTKIIALELDTDAVLQAQENVAKTAWVNRITVKHTDYKTYESDSMFDLIVSNPPYFVNALKSPQANRSQARHTDTLSFSDLIQKSAGLLSEVGHFAVIIPMDACNYFVDEALKNGLFLQKQTLIVTTPGAEPKRVVLVFSKTAVIDVVQDSLLIELERHKYSEAYIKLTKEFYLKM